MSGCALCEDAGGDLTKCSEPELVAHTQNNCEQASQILYDQHVQPLIGHLLRRTRRKDEVPEAAHEAFLETLQDYRPDKGSFRGLLFTVGRRKLYRLHKFRDRLLDLIDPIDSAEIMEASSVHGELAVHQAVARLKPIYREVIEMSAFDGLSDRDIAQVLGITVALVQTRKHEAREILAQQLYNKPRRPSRRK